MLLVPPEDFADRMAMSLTLLLTAVAFKQVVSTHLPSISYLTILDKYVLCGFLMQVLVVFQNVSDTRQHAYNLFASPSLESAHPSHLCHSLTGASLHALSHAHALSRQAVAKYEVDTTRSAWFSDHWGGE